MRIEVSHGELVDKVTILSIKARKVSDPRRWKPQNSGVCALVNPTVELVFGAAGERLREENAAGTGAARLPAAAVAPPGHGVEAQ